MVIFWVVICSMVGITTAALALAIAFGLIPMSFWWCLGPTVLLNAFCIGWCAYDYFTRKHDSP